MANKKIPDEDLEWLSQHKQSVEHRTKVLKNVGIFALIFALVFISFVAMYTSRLFMIYTLSLIVGLTAVPIFILFIVAFIFVLHFIHNDYANTVLAGLISGVVIGVVISLIYITPMVSSTAYPLSIQVFYPNHPNLTITQNCTAFTTTNSGYLNGQPINPKNTTQCNLPQSMAPKDSNPFNCNIINKSIVCLGTSAIESVTWKGTILNVSKR